VRWLHRRARMRLRELRRRRDVRDASAYDVVLLNRDLLGGRAEFEDELFRTNPRVVFDFDDAIHLGAAKAAHVGRICARAAWVTAGNAALADFALRHGERVSVLPTVVDTDAYVVRRDHERRDDPLRVGWLGSDRSIHETLVPYLPMLARLRDAIGFELVIVSKPRPVLPATAGAWRFVEWSPVVETRIAELFDVGIMPLVDEPFQRGKCGAKLLQYMAAGLPAVASPVGVNVDLVGAERGLLARSEDEWRAALAALAGDAGRRRALGEAGRSFVEREYSLRRWFPVLAEILARVADGDDLSESARDRSSPARAGGA
ncbi:glycosyltransferase, partial [Candidatus Binatia bacterium]|nr:glycosyltransferase [Candidatus Binatia bacterium]